MKISVITVCYNEEKNIIPTIESILHQVTIDFEYIICDGKSSDNTVKIAESYIDKFRNKNIDFRIYSEKDSGIYDGMNKGISYSNGDYVIFINAGDKLNDKNVISNIVKGIGNNRPAVVYGDCLVIDRGLAYVAYGQHNKLKQYMGTPHPATLVRSDIIKSNIFDTTYKIAADYNMILSLYMQNLEFYHLDLIISKFYLDGVSSIHMVDTILETAKVKQKHGIEVVNLDEQIAVAKKNEKINKIKRATPMFIWKLWNKNIKKRLWIEE